MSVLLQAAEQVVEQPETWLQFAMFFAMVTMFLLALRYVGLPVLTLLMQNRAVDQAATGKSVAVVPLALYERTVAAVEKVGEELERLNATTEKTARGTVATGRALNRHAKAIERLGESIDEHRMTGNGKRAAE